MTRRGVWPKPPSYTHSHPPPAHSSSKHARTQAILHTAALLVTPLWGLGLGTASQYPCRCCRVQGSRCIERQPEGRERKREI